jgi:hypothetical protein
MQLMMTTKSRISAKDQRIGTGERADKEAVIGDFSSQNEQ